ncbi:DUF5681 domain-containing protein [Sphingosinicella microcystinivorans]|uniref:DUF5681 domain-containing protein n=1 Tax=Sphingosinicella microcystinivorans TaxID=335406 RepID=UPI0022F3B3B0|nr:DUF5681 domain-containing protein [Sphingosinicella microcystinivorans]WBX86319.1 DUF5681 domain-containing protein [Sphingosinicella microcystinivorans]
MSKKDKKRNAGQWPAGISGNPNGRPKKTSRASGEMGFEEALAKLMMEPLPITRSGKTVHLPGQEALAYSCFKVALEAKDAEKVRLTEMILKMYRRFQSAASPAIPTFDWGEEQERLFRELHQVRREGTTI